jgi:hypothetical protein
MTVEQLIKRLSSLPQKAEVMVPSHLKWQNEFVSGPMVYKPFRDQNIQFDGPNVVIY